MPKRIRDLPALTPATGDHVVIDRPTGPTGRATISTNPTPNTLVLRNAQGAVQDGVMFEGRTGLRVNGAYLWSAANAWVPLVTWTSPNWANRGIFADLHIIRPGPYNAGGVARLRTRARFDSSGALDDIRISIANDALLSIRNAVLVQVAEDTFQLWAQFHYGHLYVNGVVGGASVVVVEITDYGNLDSQTRTSPPTPVPNGLYLEWNTATVDQTFPGPGYIVAADRSATSGYVRHDNGIQICWATITVGSGTWTYPAAFASAPRVLATAEASGVPRLVTITSVSTAAAGILRTDLSGSTSSGTVHLWAIGLWK
jgi:hypothetical protein